jgi:hypothetical protein
MTPDQQSHASLILLAENMMERSIFLNARCDALELALGVLANTMNADPAFLKGVINKAQNQAYSERLLEIERSDPGLAGRLDRRDTHGEVIADDLKMLRFEDPS